MNNPYIVHIALHAKFASHRPAVNTKRPKIKNQILEIGEKDKHGNTLYYMLLHIWQERDTYLKEGRRFFEDKIMKCPEVKKLQKVFPNLMGDILKR